MTSSATGDAPKLTPLQWLICAIAALGFAFDTYELLMLPLIVRPALSDLLGVPPNSLLVNDWVGYMQYVPAVAGGIFGLLGGYLTDRVRSPARAGVEHPAVRLLRARGRVLDVGVLAAVLALLHIRRRLRRVRRRRRVAGGAVHRSRAAGARHRLHAGVRVVWRGDGHRRVLLDRQQRRITARRSWAGTRPGATR